MAMHLVLSLAAGAALSGCAVYGPPYAAYEAAPAYYPYTYASPVYVGPPLSLSFGYYEHHYRGPYGWRGGYGWGGHGWGGRGWHGGGWHGRH
ncbi:hypothetical protein ACI48D_02345 [Massilia sp. LXY-6]|uniref:hypothetical protein n=1 Tax=Massilia sp. LXY-6 TaxID=3379823 RepID=UPI003EE0026D